MRVNTTTGEYAMPHHESAPPAGTPRIVPRPLPEGVSQALRHYMDILGLNEDITLEPGQLHGISLMLHNARNTLAEMRQADHPPAAQPTP